MSELHTHCQCDNCTGEDCGQDNPEEYEREREEERADIRQAEREKALDGLRAKYIEHNDIPCPDLALKYNHPCDVEYCGICVLDFVLEELRQKVGE